MFSGIFLVGGICGSSDGPRLISGGRSAWANPMTRGCLSALVWLVNMLPFCFSHIGFRWKRQFSKRATDAAFGKPFRKGTQKQYWTFEFAHPGKNFQTQIWFWVRYFVLKTEISDRQQLQRRSSASLPIRLSSCCCCVLQYTALCPYLNDSSHRVLHHASWEPIPHSNRSHC